MEYVLSSSRDVLWSIVDLDLGSNILDTPRPDAAGAHDRPHAAPGRGTEGRHSHQAQSEEAEILGALAVASLVLLP